MSLNKQGFPTERLPAGRELTAQELVHIEEACKHLEHAAALLSDIAEPTAMDDKHLLEWMLRTSVTTANMAVEAFRALHPKGKLS